MSGRILTVVVVIASITATSMAGEIEDAITRAGGDLVSDQQGSGSWLEFGFTGESVAGLANAYLLTGQAGYKTAAESGGDYCLYDEGGYNNVTGEYLYGLYASGAYGLTRLSQISATPASNTWRTAVDDLYEQIRTGNGTQAYINSYFNNSEDSSAVYDIARHTMAAFYVGATDQGLFRSGLIDALADIQDGDASPVMALGVAVWGLAQTGSMDSTLVDPGAAGGSLWDGVELADLAGMLAGEQALDGSFYTKFDHGQGSGFTETTAMGTLGLIAADGSTYASEILDARLVLAGGVDTGGDVYWKIGDNSFPQYYFAAGETLEALPEPVTLMILGIGGMICFYRRPRSMN